MKIILVALSCLCSIFSNAQTVKILTSGHKTGMRGLSVVDDKTIWVSGTGGQVGRSLDSDNTWKWFTVKGFERMDFRDIEAFNETTAVIRMKSGNFSFPEGKLRVIECSPVLHGYFSMANFEISVQLGSPVSVVFDFFRNRPSIAPS